ncbi:MAG: hypothetical protein ACI8X5_003310 [Planctomycetota bacterium]|jgi:hypothetical protein
MRRKLPRICWRNMVRPGTLRILISDFLSPHDSATLVRSLAGRAGGFAIFQVLSKQNARPEVGSAFRIQDAEIVLDPAAVDDHLVRFGRLTRSLDTAYRRAATRFYQLVASEGLDSICREELAQAGFVQSG